MRQSWTSELVVQTIKELKADGEKINSNHIQLNNGSLYGAALRYFGGWKQATEAAGINYSSLRVVPEKRTWTQTKIVKAVRARHRKGLSLNGSSVYEEDRGLYSAAKRHFGNGGWKKALIIAGFDPLDISPKRVWKREKVIAAIKARNKKGEPLYGYYLNRNGLAGLYGAGKNIFGSWKKAIEVAGLDYDEIKRRHNWWSVERVISEIQKHEANGSELSSNAIRVLHNDLFSAAILYCGSWAEAVTAAGYDYQQHCKVWSSKAWLRTKRKNLKQEEKP